MGDWECDTALVMMKGLIRIGRHSLYNVRLLSYPRQVQPIVFRNPKLPVYVKKATLQNMLETMVKPLTPDELKNVLRSLLTVDDPSLVSNYCNYSNFICIEN